MLPLGSSKTHLASHWDRCLWIKEKLGTSFPCLPLAVWQCIGCCLSILCSEDCFQSLPLYWVGTLLHKAMLLTITIWGCLDYNFLNSYLNIECLTFKTKDQKNNTHWKEDFYRNNTVEDYEVSVDIWMLLNRVIQMKLFSVLCFAVGTHWGKNTHTHTHTHTSFIHTVR